MQKWNLVQWKPTMNILLCLVLLSFKNNLLSSISCAHELRKIRLKERKKTTNLRL